MPATKSLSDIDAAEFFGFESEVKQMVAAPVPSLQQILLSEAGIKWDGKTPLWQTIIEAAKAESSVDRGYYEWAAFENRKSFAMRIIEYDKAIPNTLPLATVEHAKKVIAAEQPKEPAA